MAPNHDSHLSNQEYSSNTSENHREDGVSLGHIMIHINNARQDKCIVKIWSEQVTGPFVEKGHVNEKPEKKLYKYD